MHDTNAGAVADNPRSAEQDRARGKIEVCTFDELAKEKWAHYVDGKLELIVALIDNQVKIYDGICPHKGAPLYRGTCSNGEIECPWHGCRFSLRNGYLRGSKITALKSYSSAVEGGIVYAMV